MSNLNVQIVVYSSEVLMVIMNALVLINSAAEVGIPSISPNPIVYVVTVVAVVECLLFFAHKSMGRFYEDGGLGNRVPEWHRQFPFVLCSHEKFDSLAEGVCAYLLYLFITFILVGGTYVNAVHTAHTEQSTNRPLSIVTFLVTLIVATKVAFFELHHIQDPNKRETKAAIPIMWFFMCTCCLFTPLGLICVWVGI